MNKSFLFSLIVLLLACRDKTEVDSAYLHGEIVNPLTNYILLYKDNALIDTIFLGRDNLFSYCLPNTEEGLYTFRHASETQTIYLEPEDSILFRTNTVAFDETLYFSGSAAAKNNFLVENFLLNEKNNTLVFSYYEIPPKKFAALTDSIRRSRKKAFRDLQSKNDFSDKFNSLAKKSIAYEYYDLRERYAFLINKYFGQRTIPDKFFNYRQKVDFNKASLQNLYVYLRFLDNYLKNRSIEDCGPRRKNRDCYNLNDYDNLQRRILLADSLFQLEVLRARFFRRFGRKQLIFSKHPTQIDSTLNLLRRLGYSKEGIQELKQLGELQNSYFIGNNVSDKKLYNNQLEKILLGEVIAGPTITFSWTMDQPQAHRQKHEKIGQFRKKYPEVDFIGFNIDDSETKAWTKTLKNNGYDPRFEYQIRNAGEKKILYKNYLGKVLFINEKGKIVFGNISLSDPNFENYILEFLNM